MIIDHQTANVHGKVATHAINYAQALSTSGNPLVNSNELWWWVPGQLHWGSSGHFHRRGCQSHETKCNRGMLLQERLSICRPPHTQFLGASCMHKEHTTWHKMHNWLYPELLCSTQALCASNVNTVTRLKLLLCALNVVRPGAKMQLY